MVMRPGIISPFTFRILLIALVRPYTWRVRTSSKGELYSQTRRNPSSTMHTSFRSHVGVDPLYSLCTHTRSRKQSYRFQCYCIRHIQYNFLCPCLLICSETTANGLRGTDQCPFTYSAEVSLALCIALNRADFEDGLLVLLCNRTHEQDGALDALVVASERFAMVLEDGELVFQRGNVGIRDVTGIGILRDEF